MEEHIARLELKGDRTAAEVLRKLMFLGLPREILEEIALGLLGSEEERAAAMRRALLYLEGVRDSTAHSPELYVLLEHALRERLSGLAKLSRTLLAMNPAMVSAVLETVPPHLEEAVKNYLAACMSACYIEPQLVPELFLGELLTLDALCASMLAERDSLKRWKLVSEIQKLCGERTPDLKSALERERERRRKLELQLLQIARGGER